MSRAPTAEVPAGPAEATAAERGARCYLALPDDTVGWSTAIAVIAAATMTLGNIAALPGSDPALVYYAMAYTATNLAAFAVVRERHPVDLDAFRGLGHAHPWWTAALALSLLSLLGLPPLAAFTAVISLYYYLRVIAATVAFGVAEPVLRLSAHAQMLTGG